MAALGRCVRVSATDVDALVALAAAERADLTLVGPEAPLAAGLVDALRAGRHPVFGPTKGAAEIETSKVFAKKLMLHAGVPTAQASSHRDPAEAKTAARALGAPVVIKASGLAAGKGVIVCRSTREADRAIDLMLREGAFGTAGSEILVEAFMRGEELSLFALCDGERVLPMLPARDYKRLLEGDEGPNTGGMGAYAPVGGVPGELVETIVESILLPTISALREHGRRFTGLLYAGLMLTSDGPRVVEFNCRFGDPETQTLMPLMDSELLAPIQAVAAGEGLAGASPIRWAPRHAVTTVVAAAGYPQSPRVGARITLPPPAPGVHLFHAATEIDGSGRLATAGGRVLSVTAVADSIDEARERSRRSAELVAFEGRQFRADIGFQESGRGAGAA